MLLMISRMHFCNWMVKPQLLAVIFITIFCHIQAVTCLSFNFPIFKPEDQNDRLLLSDVSRIYLDAIQVTPDAYGADFRNRFGRAFYNKAYRVWSKKKNQTASFNTSFILNINPNVPSSNTGAAGEGLAFILAADTSLPPNSYGRWLGIVNSSTNGTSDAAILAVEFDTRNNGPDDGPNGHVGVNVNSIFSIKQVPLLPLGINISSGVNVSVRIQYDNDVISVFGYMMNGTKSKEDLLLQSPPLNLTSYLSEKVFLGFSASTSNFMELNCIRAWDFNGVDIGDGNQDLLWVWITVPTVVVIAGAVTFFLIWRWRRNREITEDAYPRIEDQIKCSSMAPKKFSLREIKRATGNFNDQNKLGEGGFGKVYKGILGNTEIAVKRVSKDSRQGKQEFIAEVTTIGSLHHKNLVKLIGWCYERNELLIVYEFMPNGSLDKYLFENSHESSLYENLHWETRYNVIHGVAEALDYLHNGCDKKVFHRDIKASNIMLDSEFNARLGDFGLARTIQKRNETHHSTQGIAGTPGYMAPETFLTGRATVETDVYAFGVLIMEVVCGRRPGNMAVDNDYKKSVVYWVWEMYGNGRILEGVDKRMKKEIEGDEERVERVIVLGLACCHPNPHKRPSMKTVLQVLTGKVAPPDVPRERPAFVWPAAPPSFNVHDNNSVNSAQLPPPFTVLTGR